MRTIIEELGELVAQQPGVKVQYELADMLVTLSLGDSRRQTVKVSTEQPQHLPYAVLRLRSRACMAADASVVRQALQTNAALELGALALEASVSPPMIDVVHTVIAHNVDFRAFYRAMKRVARLADDIERRASDIDAY